MASIDEEGVALAVMEIAAERDNGIVTFKEIYKLLPQRVYLSDDDQQLSETRQNEPMWHQKVRNIKSHEQTEGNAIYEGWLESIPRQGFRITDKGRHRIKRKR